LTLVGSIPRALRSFTYFVLARLVDLLTGGGRVSQLQLENAVLGHQVKILRRTVRRPELRDRDRAFLAAASRALCRDRWASFMVTPQTLLRWHRELVRRKWTYRRRGAGRPPLGPEVTEPRPPSWEGEPAVGVRADPGRAPQARYPGRSQHHPPDPSSSRPRARSSPDRSDVDRVPPSARPGSAGLRLLHGRDDRAEDPLRLVLIELATRRVHVVGTTRRPTQPGSPSRPGTCRSPEASMRRSSSSGTGTPSSPGPSTRSSVPGASAS